MGCRASWRTGSASDRRIPRPSPGVAVPTTGFSSHADMSIFSEGLPSPTSSPHPARTQIGVVHRPLTHLPPGTSKWVKIEHRLFCFITKNWRGRSLTEYHVIVNLIANTTTAAGLVVKAEHDTRQYETGITVSDEELSRVRITRSSFHGDWTYAIRPRN